MCKGPDGEPDNFTWVDTWEAINKLKSEIESLKADRDIMKKEVEEIKEDLRKLRKVRSLL